MREVLDSREADAVQFLARWRETQLKYLHIDTIFSRDHRSFRDPTRSLLVHTCIQTGAHLSTETIERLVSSWEDLTPYSDVNTTLHELKKAGYTIALLSNGDRDMLQRVCGKLEAMPSHIFPAEDAGVYRPHPKVYAKAVEATGFDVRDVVHVADGSIDIVGSKSFGYFTVWVNRNNTPREELPFATDLVLENLTPLLKKLQEQ